MPPEPSLATYLANLARNCRFTFLTPWVVASPPSAQPRSRLVGSKWRSSARPVRALVAGRVDKRLSGEIKDAVRSLESIQVRDLMKLLGSVKAEATSMWPLDNHE
jgi:hypothetical protein